METLVAAALAFYGLQDALKDYSGAKWDAGRIILEIIVGLVVIFILWRSRGFSVMKEELEIQRGRANRLTEENKTLIQENATLKARTDLTALMDLIRAQEKNNTDTHLQLIQTFHEFSDRYQERNSSLFMAVNENQKVLTAISVQMETSARLLAELLLQVRDMRETHLIAEHSKGK